MRAVIVAAAFAHGWQLFSVLVILADACLVGISLPGVDGRAETTAVVNAVAAGKTDTAWALMD
ncbi:MAG: hypothetical protein WCP19_04780 [Chloroflexota bacterium]